MGDLLTTVMRVAAGAPESTRQPLIRIKQILRFQPFIRVEPLFRIQQILRIEPLFRLQQTPITLLIRD